MPKINTGLLAVLAIGGVVLIASTSGKSSGVPPINPTQPNTPGTPVYPNPGGATRGLRNNNPGNIVHNNIVYNGEIIPSTDPKFKQFTSMDLGYRALFEILYAYQVEGYNTIQTIINRWAPPSDGNNTIAYILDVSNATGLDPNQEVSFDFPEDMEAIAGAISQQENGIAADQNALQAGYDLFQQSNPTM